MFKLKVNNKGRVAATTIQRVDFDRAFLNKVGKVIRDEIVKEAKKQAVLDPKRGSGYRPFVSDEDQYETGSVPEGIPRSSKFFDSIQYRVTGSKIEIFSDWPWISQIVEGRDPYKMTWLTKVEGVKVVPMQDPMGKVIFRSTPNSASDAWIHPGFAKHTFIHEGWKKATFKVKKMYAQEALRIMLKQAFK